MALRRVLWGAAMTFDDLTRLAAIAALVLLPILFLLKMIEPADRGTEPSFVLGDIVTATNTPLDDYLRRGSHSEPSATEQPQLVAAPINIENDCRARFADREDAGYLVVYCIEQERLFRARWGVLGESSATSTCARRWTTWKMRVQCVEQARVAEAL